MALKLLAKTIGVSKIHSNSGFKNFNVNKTNEKQYNICKKWDGKSSIILTGKPGTGKTHLAVAMLKNFPMQPKDKERDILWAKKRYEDILNEMVEKKVDIIDGLSKEKVREYLDRELYKLRNARVRIISVVDLLIELNDLVMSGKSKGDYLMDYINDYSYDCVCFDDWGAERFTEATRQNLYYIIDNRYRRELPTIITSNNTIQEIAEVEPRIASRMAEMGRILQFNGEDYRKSIKKEYGLRNEEPVI